MNCKIGIHSIAGSFSDRWCEYCALHKISYKELNMFDTDFIEQLKKYNIKGFLFHLPLFDLKAQLFSSYIVRSVELIGVRVFPSNEGFWHFDDKIAQKYLFESFDVPMCKTWVFFDREQALNWAEKTSYPKIFKLRRGAGSHNVKMINSSSQAKKIIHKMFDAGIKPVSGILTDYKTAIYKHNKQKDWMGVAKRLPSTLANIKKMKMSIPNEKGYAYFQDYLPDNDYDTRITVVGDRAYAFRRFTRPGDFRASGSGRIDWTQDTIDKKCLQIAFDASSRIGSQCLAFDFVYDSAKSPVVLEVSYAFVADAVYNCPGYWDIQMNYHSGQSWPQDAILIDMFNLL